MAKTAHEKIQSIQSEDPLTSRVENLHDEPTSVGSSAQRAAANNDLATNTSLFAAVESLSPSETACLEVHPLCEIMPEMQEVEIEGLRRDIMVNGILFPIVVMLNGGVIDGRHRLRIAKALGLGVPVRYFLGDEAQASDYVMSLNLSRRHLTTSQRTAIAVQYYDPSGQVTHGGDRRLESRAGLLTDEEYAKRASISVRYWQDGKRIKKHCPDLIPEIVKGPLTVSAACKKCFKAKAEDASHTCGCSATCESEQCPLKEARSELAEANRLIAELKAG